jgi:hypothetical protein
MLAACILLCGSLAQAQSITGVYPNGTNLFQPSPTLSFTASSTVAVTNVTVQLTVTSLSAGTTFVKSLTAASGLTISGPSTSESVSAALTSNTLYSATIQIWDANGATASQTIAYFDTIIPVYTWEAEDWDYTDGTTDGKYIDNPQTNAYANLLTAAGGSGNAGPGAYRPDTNSSGSFLYPSTEVNGDIPRKAYIGTGFTDYDVGWTGTGLFENYTRHYPAGTYNLYARASGGNGPQVNSGVFSTGSGTAVINGTAPFKFGVQGRGWQSYDFMPVTDANGTNVTVTLDGTASTFVVTQGANANDNMNFFMLMPVNTNPPVAGATFTNFNPNGSVQFQPTNWLTFNVVSAPGVAAANVSVILSGTNLIGQAAVSNYTTANGLVITGPITNLNVNVPLASNMTYTVFVQALDQNGNAGTTKLVFDTISPSYYTFDAEDYNYNGGAYFDNPQTNAYAGVFGVSGVDYSVDDPLSGNHNYRDGTPGIGGPETEGSGDRPRVAYTNGLPDYDVGFNDPANWENYTRHFPNGTYNIIVRAANGGGGGGNISFAQVTSDPTVSGQTVTNLGSAAVPATGNWQQYVFAPVKDNNGNLAQITFSGSNPETLRAVSPSSANAQFYLLAPANTSQPVITGFYPDGTAFFQQTNKLSFTVTAQDGIPTNNVVVTVNGVVVNPTFAGTSASRQVSYSGLQPNSLYTISVSVTSSTGGTISKTVTFDTYSASYYQFEAADYNYTSNGVAGLYIDNPQTNAYNGLTVTLGIDQTAIFGPPPLNEDLYRLSPDGITPIISTQAGGDLNRAQFANTVPPYTTWRINWFGYGDFINYTRHFPAGKYNIVGRFTNGGGGTTTQVLKMVTGSAAVSNQTTVEIGTFHIPVNGWNGWEWATLLDGSSNAVVVTFDGSATTLQLDGPDASDVENANTGFFMLVPVTATGPGITITATVSGGLITIKFPTTTGSNYQVLYKTNLTDASWTALGSPIAGNNAVQSVQDTITGSHRFYRVQIQ